MKTANARIEWLKGIRPWQWNKHYANWRGRGVTCNREQGNVAEAKEWDSQRLGWYLLLDSPSRDCSFPWIRVLFVFNKLDKENTTSTQNHSCSSHTPSHMTRMNDHIQHTSQHDDDPHERGRNCDNHFSAHTSSRNSQSHSIYPHVTIALEHARSWRRSIPSLDCWTMEWYPWNSPRDQTNTHCSTSTSLWNMGVEEGLGSDSVRSPRATDAIVFSSCSLLIISFTGSTGSYETWLVDFCQFVGSFNRVP